jgi:hypothetical protein
MSDIIRTDLMWWISRINLAVGVKFPAPPIDVTLTADASNWGWGAHTDMDNVQGQWTTQEATSHINLLELWAVFKGLQQLCHAVINRRVLVKSDNSTVVSYINKQGGTKSPSLCLHTRKLWYWCIDRGVMLTAIHIPGVENILADNLSRGVSLNPTEWSLSRQVFHELYLRRGFPTIDLFASQKNHQLPVYCSLGRDIAALAWDALSIPWNNMAAYAFPPISLIHKVLQKISREDCVVLLVAPMWPRQFWFHDLTRLMVDFPLYCSLRIEIYSECQGRKPGFTMSNTCN